MTVTCYGRHRNGEVAAILVFSDNAVASYSVTITRKGDILVGRNCSSGDRKRIARKNSIDSLIFVPSSNRRLDFGDHCLIVVREIKHACRIKVDTDPIPTGGACRTNAKSGKCRQNQRRSRRALRRSLRPPKTSAAPKPSTQEAPPCPASMLVRWRQPRETAAGGTAVRRFSCKVYRLAPRI